MKLILAFLLFALPIHAALAAETFASGEAELGDIASPAEIYGEMLREGVRLDDSINIDFTIGLKDPRDAAVYVLVDKSRQHLWVWENGQLFGDWAVSTGSETVRCPPNGRCYTAHTPSGVFSPKSLHYTYTSRSWEARMDRAIFIVGGIALHATYGDHIRMLGRRDSGGCIRQHPTNADRLFRLVSKYGRANTRVRITN
ncbi:MAG: L,D-transpeptidase [Bacteriovoracia bacterium]